ncbi:hypothetical protein [Mycobacterium malmoense]|uniref:hypothetical protein n=1 Tax=Mycobacterium malmoense TaxID=1780 RepID=UPI00113236B8|nr:hypothetical protein [Mycobacterium malmoense]
MLMTRASRGIGCEIAVRAVAVGLVEKTRTPNAKFEEVLRDEGGDDVASYRLAAREDDLAPNLYLPVHAAADGLG